MCPVRFFGPNTPFTAARATPLSFPDAPNANPAKKPTTDECHSGTVGGKNLPTLAPAADRFFRRLERATTERPRDGGRDGKRVDRR